MLAFRAKPDRAVVTVDPHPNQITQLLHSWSQGDASALEELMPLVYGELHRIAERYMSDEASGHTLQTTALVNEAYLRLIRGAGPDWQSRNHFFAVSAQVMRHILVDWARSHQTQKRGSGVAAVELDEKLAVPVQSSSDLVAIDDALKALALIDARKSQIVELHFFGGLSVQETAEVLKVSQETVFRDWRLAKSWLRRELSKESSREE
jgi:RNA polymerase sigma-70 factor, ECF subfamily